MMLKTFINSNVLLLFIDSIVQGRNIIAPDDNLSISLNNYDDYAFLPETCFSCPKKTYGTCFLQHSDPQKFIACDNYFEKVMTCPLNFTWSFDNEYCVSKSGMAKIDNANGLEYNEAMNAFITPMNIRLQTESRTGSLIINKQDPNFQNICSRCSTSDGLPYSCYISALINTQFYECNVGVPKLLSCPSNSFWNNRYQTCLSNNYVKSGHLRLKTSRKGRSSRSTEGPLRINKSHHVCDYCQIQNKNICLYPNFENESQYFSCQKLKIDETESTKAKMSKPLKATYIFSHHQCEEPNQVYKQNLQACIGKMQQTQSRLIEIEQIDSIYKDKCNERCSNYDDSCLMRIPDDTKYLECYNGIPVVHNCPIGHTFDENKGFCESNGNDNGFGLAMDGEYNDIYMDI